jgi:uncharacterized protein (TIGR03435 family)
MVRWITAVGFVLLISGGIAQQPPVRARFDAFEVATIKRVDPEAKASRFIRMQGNNRFVATNYTMKLLLAAAYDLNPRAISGGPAWMDADKYDVVAVTPGDVRPSRDEQMAMLRKLIEERFKLRFHREPKELSMYVLEVAKGGPKLKASSARAEDASNVICTVYPGKILLPARNVTIGDVTRMMQRAIFDRPVVDATGLSARYDFDLQWAPDESQFGGEIPAATEAATDPPLFVAMEQQLGLKLEARRGPVSTMVVDGVERPTAN